MKLVAPQIILVRLSSRRFRLPSGTPTSLLEASTSRARALGRLCGSLGGALVEPWGGLGVALGWLCTPESMPSIWLVYGFVVALGGFEMNWPQHPKWNQPRKGARDAARQSRSRSQNSLNAETQRFAEGRKEGRKKRLFSSAFLRPSSIALLRRVDVPLRLCVNSSQL